MIIRTIYKSSKMDYIPTTADVLAEHLHSKIVETMPDWPGHVVEKVTRVLMDCNSNKEIHMMLGNTVVLKNSVDKVLESFRGLSMGSRDESLAENLHESVSQLEQNIHLQEKITGMILELEEKHIKQLLASPSEMKKAVDKAKHVCMKSLMNKSACVIDSTLDHYGNQSVKCKNPTNTADLQDFKDKEELGEILFEKVNRIYPEEATQITGMLLELDGHILLDLIESEEALHECIERAHSAVASKTASKWSCQLS